MSNIRLFLKFTAATSAWLKDHLSWKGSAAWMTYSNRGSLARPNGMIAGSSAVTSVQTQRGETDGERPSLSFNKARPNLLRLLWKRRSDLAFAPKLCFWNISREARKKRIKMMNPFSQGHLEIDFFYLTPHRLKKGCWSGKVVKEGALARAGFGI